MPEMNVYGSIESQSCSHEGDDCALRTGFLKHQSVAECQAAKQAKREQIQKKIDELTSLDVEGQISQLQAELNAI